ncbi:MAG: TMEM165/GDT1 family protein [Lachnospiraceae bacterium]|nr:TMEM165/GDT1 family protein [Lachnospiraceae bacterium]
MLFTFLSVLGTEFIAEMGDKTQFMLIGLTSKYKLKDIILGTAVAVLILNGLAVLAGGLVGSLIPEYVIKAIAGVVFLLFAISALKKDDEDEEAEGDGKIKFAPLAVFCTFFIAELGDKTQITAATFGASNGLGMALVVWIACSIGLFAADIVGLVIGYVLKKKAPEDMMKKLSFVIFAVFGIYTLFQAYQAFIVR